MGADHFYKSSPQLRCSRDSPFVKGGVRRLPAYRRIINALPDQDRMIMEEYIMLSEELDSRCTYLLIDKISF